MNTNSGVKKIGGIIMGATMGIMALTSPAQAGTRINSLSANNGQEETCPSCLHANYQYDPNDNYSSGFSVGKNAAVDMAVNIYVSRSLGGQLDKAAPTIMKDYQQFQKGVEMGKKCPEGTYEWYQHHIPKTETEQAFANGFVRSYQITHPKAADLAQREKTMTLNQGYIDGFKAGMLKGFEKVAALETQLANHQRNYAQQYKEVAKDYEQSHSFSAWIFGGSNFDKQMAADSMKNAKYHMKEAQIYQTAVQQAQQAEQALTQKNR
jgi:superfamily II DNA helicase RecQ